MPLLRKKVTVFVLLKMDDKARENHVKYVLNQKMLETGEKERLKEMLRQRLTESGWHDEGIEY